MKVFEFMSNPVQIAREVSPAGVLAIKVTGLVPRLPWLAMLLVLACMLGHSRAHAQPFSVTYIGNGADGGLTPTDVNSPYAANSTPAVLSNNSGFTRAGFVFQDWNTVSGGAGTRYSPGANTSPLTADIILYAPVSYTHLTLPTNREV